MDKIFNVKVKGKDLDYKFPISYIEVTNSVNNIPYCVIKLYEFTDIDKEFLLNNSDLKIGSDVEIEYSDDKDKSTIFTGIIVNKSFFLDSDIEESYVVLKCYHKFFNMTLTTKCSYFIDKTDKEIVEEILSKYGYSSNVGLMILKREFLYQNNISDWDFINNIARHYGYVVDIDKDKLIIDKPKHDKSSQKITLGDNVININLTLDGESQIEGFEGKYWDIKKQSCSNVESSNNNSENSFGNVNSSDLLKNSGKQKCNIINDSFNETEYKIYLDCFVELNRYSKIQGNITILGNKDIKQNTTIEISNFSDVFNGSAYINKVQHIYKNEYSGWITKIYVGLKKQDNYNIKDNFNIGNIVGLKYGVVLKVDGDPENNFRVFVNIPTINKSEEGIWCRLSSIYASNNCGVTFFPEKGDEVILGFIENNPKEPIIIGNVYNSKNKSSVTIDAENNIKSIKTKSGMEINFNEKDKILKINTSEKRSITISDKDESLELLNDSGKIVINKDSIEVKTSKDIKIDGNNITLSAKGTIKIKGTNEVNLDGNNLKVNGGIGVNIKGGTNTKIESSGITEVKGTMVKIN